MQFIAQVATRHRADGAGRRKRVADHELLRDRYKGVHEAPGHGLFNNETLGRNAALPGVLKARLHAHRSSGLDVGIGQHDEGVRAAELQHLFFQRLSGHRRNAASHRRRAGKSNGGNAIVLNQSGDR